jgi:hypothetical protein
MTRFAVSIAVTVFSALLLVPGPAAAAKSQQCSGRLTEYSRTQRAIGNVIKTSPGRSVDAYSCRTARAVVRGLLKRRLNYTPCPSQIYGEETSGCKVKIPGIARFTCYSLNDSVVRLQCLGTRNRSVEFNLHVDYRPGYAD